MANISEFRKQHGIAKCRAMPGTIKSCYTAKGWKLRQAAFHAAKELPVSLPPILKTTPAPLGRACTIHVDGSCPSNPGPMGIGYVIKYDDINSEHSSDIRTGFRLQDGTNNQAEYLSLIHAMRDALRTGVTRATIHADSLLMVNQVNMVWRCRDKGLKPLCEEARGLSNLFSQFTLSHIPRELNTLADELSKNPTDTAPVEPDAEINFRPADGRAGRRMLARHDAAMIRWWWVTGRCRNAYLLSRIYGKVPSVFFNIGEGKHYKDLNVTDLPRGIAAQSSEHSSDISQVTMYDPAAEAQARKTRMLNRDK